MELARSGDRDYILDNTQRSTTHVHGYERCFLLVPPRNYKGSYRTAPVQLLDKATIEERLGYWKCLLENISDYRINGLLEMTIGVEFQLSLL
jgi:hypothetical protein